MKITVLGAGMVGSAIAKDLAQETELEVMVVDLNRNALEKLKTEPSITGVRVNLQEDNRVFSIASESDFLISAVPGFMGFETLREIIKAGKNVVDISFFSEDPFLLDELAKSKGVTAVVDCGVAPGLCNILAGYGEQMLDQTHRYECYVGGLPKNRKWPFEYKAGFSPSDVLEEYTRPARFVQDGKEVIHPALSGVELIDLPHTDTLEAFNTDGLRSLIKTLNIPFMREKTLRYPGHANLMRIFRESGFFNREAIEVDHQMVSPIALTSKLLFDQWQFEEGEADFTVMQVIIEGEKNGERICHTYDLLDRYDQKTDTSSMARTTGYTCSIISRQLIKGLFTRKGICPPEFIGQTKGCYEDLKTEYKKRNIHISETLSK